jgi:hypothetical protein
MGILQGLVSDGRPASSGGQLYAAWKHQPNDDQTSFSRWGGSGNWGAVGSVGANTSSGPSLGMFGGSLYAAWKGEWSDPRLFFAKYNGSSWEAQAQIPNAYSDIGPALCEFNGTQFIAAWKNFDQNLYFAIYDGSHWTAPAPIAGTASSVGPSLATYGGKLYAAWKGLGTDESLWYADYDGTKWSGQTNIAGVASSVGPSLAGYGGKLYAVWKGQGGDQSLWYADYDGTKWSGQTQLAGVASSTGAAIAEFNGKLYAMWKGEGTDVSLYNAAFDGTTWSAQAKDIPGTTGPDTVTLLPAPTGGNVNYLLSDSKGAALSGTTVTIIVVEDIVPDSAEAYSFQVNCNSPAQASGAAAYVWQQYGFAIAANELFFWLNCYRQQDLPASPHLQWDSRPPRMPNNAGVVPLTNNRVPKGWQLTVSLVTDHSGNVTGFAFSIAQADGTVLNSPTLTLTDLNTTVVSGNLASILNCQALLVGENGGRTTDFSAGQGIFLSAETNNLTASVSQDETGEGSNLSYSSLPASYPNGEFYQFFGVPSA